MTRIKVDYRGFVFGFLIVLLVAFNGCECVFANHPVIFPEPATPSSHEATIKAVDALTNVERFTGLHLFVFTIDNCQPCNQSKPTIKKLQDAGYPIEVITCSSKDTKTANLIRNAKLKAYPTFMLCRVTSGDKYKALTRFGYDVFLEQRIINEFGRYSEMTTPEEKKTARRRGTTPRQEPPDISYPDSPDATTPDKQAPPPDELDPDVFLQVVGMLLEAWLRKVFWISVLFCVIVFVAACLLCEILYYCYTWVVVRLHKITTIWPDNTEDEA